MRKINKLISGLMITSILVQPLSCLALTKEETVYSNLDYDGKNIRSVVNNRLTSIDTNKIIDDTELKDILNINGEEKFKQKDRVLTFDSKGSREIFYQGRIDKQLPIDVTVKYYLDGQEMKIPDILGKKGQVEIKLELNNNDYREDKGLYTPFVVTVGTIIDGKNNSNVEITNGKVISTGNKSMALSVAAPGMYENFSMEEFKELDKVTLSYETDNFSLNNIYLVATPKLLDESDLRIFNKVDSLADSVNVIQENMDKIENGSKELAYGSEKLFVGSSEIASNLKAVLRGLDKLENGSKVLDNSLQQIIKTLEETQQMLNDKNISGSLENLKILREQNSIVIMNLSNTNSLLKVNYDNYQLGNFSSDDELIGYFRNVGVDEATINNLLTCKKTYEANFGLIKLLNTNNEALGTTIKSLGELSEQITVLLTKLTTVLGSVDDGAIQINSGIVELQTGVNKLYGGSLELVKGIRKLDEGTITLTDGIATLNRDGINKLNNYTEVAADYSKKINKLLKISKEYSGYATNKADTTTFIYKIKSAK